MTTELLANLRGDTGPIGPTGPVNPSSAPTDTALAGWITTAGGSATQTAGDNRWGTVLNVKAFGATGDGVADDSTAIQAAVTAAPAGAVIWFPRGTYFCRKINGTGKSNITFDGVRGASILKFRTTGSGANDSLVGWNEAVAPGTNDHHVTFRNLTFIGVNIFNEHQAQLHLSAIDDLTVENCTFKQFQGDAIFVGRTAVGGADTGVVNRRWKIVNNFFDGVDYTNRNAISVMACDDLLIAGNTFTRCSSPTMPGAIDVEPNSFDTTASVTDLTIVNNTFKDCGGFAADIGSSIVPAASPIARWEISGNTHSGSRAGAVKLERYNRGATDADPLSDISVHDNIIGQPHATSTKYAFAVMGLRGVAIDRNKVTKWTNGVLFMGYDAASKVLDISVQGNTFRECGGGAVNYLVSLNVGARIEISRNTAVKTGTGLDALILVAGAGPTQDVIVRDNTLRGTGELLFKAAGTTTTNTNWAVGNIGGVAAVATYFGHINTPS